MDFFLSLKTCRKARSTYLGDSRQLDEYSLTVFHCKGISNFYTPKPKNIRTSQWVYQDLKRENWQNNYSRTTAPLLATLRMQGKWQHVDPTGIQNITESKNQEKRRNFSNLVDILTFHINICNWLCTICFVFSEQKLWSMTLLVIFEMINNSKIIIKV